MWSADPSWPPPRPVRHRPYRAAYVFALLMPVALVIMLALPWAAAVAYRNSSWGQSQTDPNRGLPGVGDPYFPDYGSGGYDALQYQITINWDPDRQRMQSTTRIHARATQQLDAFFFDLALTTDKVSVNGIEAQFKTRDFQDVEVTPVTPIPAGAAFTVTVDYSGDPGSVNRDGIAGWRSNGQEWTAAGEPESSAWWFPANDHPSDPALMDVSVRVPAGMEAVSVGRLASRDTQEEADFDTWRWVSRQPLATYLSFLAIGQFELKTSTVNGLPTTYAVSAQLGEIERKQAFAALEKSSAVVKTLEPMFGPYPFTELGGIVVATELPFAGLEAQTRPVYASSAILDADFATELVVHELAHMWFGNNVTVAEWNDIFTNEAYASWAAWGYDEQVNRRPANDKLNRVYDRVKDSAEFWQITMIDPGKVHLFDTVYTRGPMTLQALRNVMGDPAFFALATQWSQKPGSRSLEEWMVAAQSQTKVDLVPFFRAWIFADVVPTRTAENGFRS